MSLKSFTAKLAVAALLATSLALPVTAASAAGNDAVLPAPVISSSNGTPTIQFEDGVVAPDGLEYHWFYRAGRYYSTASAGSLLTLENPANDKWDAVVACVSLSQPTAAWKYNCSSELKFSESFDRFRSAAVLNGSRHVDGVQRVELPSFVDPSSARYVWWRSGKPILGATSATYTIAPEDIGYRITVRVSYVHPFGLNGSGTDIFDAVYGLRGRLSAAHPTLSGKTSRGSKATVNLGSWTPGTKFAFQWMRNGNAIKGETKGTYTISTADAGRSIFVEVTGSKPGFNTVLRRTQNSLDVPELKLATSAPKLSGTAQVGKTLSMAPGKWTAGATLKIQWYSTGQKSGSTKLIKGATGTSYTVQPGDVGRYVWALVTGSKAQYETKSISTMASQWVVKGNLAAATPKITGTVKVGKTLTAKAGTWTSGTKLRYQWLSNGKTIRNAIKSTHKVTRNDVSQKISVKVTGSKSGYNSKLLTSNTTVKVKS